MPTRSKRVAEALLLVHHTFYASPPADTSNSPSGVASASQSGMNTGWPGQTPMMTPALPMSLSREN